MKTTNTSASSATKTSDSIGRETVELEKTKQNSEWLGEGFHFAPHQVGERASSLLETNKYVTRPTGGCLLDASLDGLGGSAAERIQAVGKVVLLVVQEPAGIRQAAHVDPAVAQTLQELRHAVHIQQHPRPAGTARTHARTLDRAASDRRRERSRGERTCSRPAAEPWRRPVPWEAALSPPLE